VLGWVILGLDLPNLALFLNLVLVGPCMLLMKASRPLIRVFIINDNHCGLTFLFEI
jgi:hypothetical protein